MVHLCVLGLLAAQLAKTDRARFGRFWYRFDGGESGADVYDRVTAFLESLYRIMENDNRYPPPCSRVAPWLVAHQ